MKIDMIMKSLGEPDERGEADIEGILTTPDLDLEGETIDPQGLDFSYFLEKGFFNWNHQPRELLGYPTAVDTTPEGVSVRGKLLLHIPKAREIYALAKSFKDTPRALGFSIEGQALKRNGNRIQKARVFHVAITNTPINPACSLIVKGGRVNTIGAMRREVIRAWITKN